MESEKLGIVNVAPDSCKCTCRGPPTWELHTGAETCRAVMKIEGRRLAARINAVDRTCQQLCQNDYDALHRQQDQAKLDQEKRNSIPEDVCLGPIRNLYTQYKLTDPFNEHTRRCWRPNEEQKCSVMTEGQIRIVVAEQLGATMAQEEEEEVGRVSRTLASTLATMAQMVPKTCSDVIGAKARRFGGGCKCTNPSHRIRCFRSFPEALTEEQELPQDVSPTDRWKGKPGEKFLLKKALAPEACAPSLAFSTAGGSYWGILYCAEHPVPPLRCTIRRDDMKD